jgi:hypothetical protein
MKNLLQFLRIIFHVDTNDSLYKIPDSIIKGIKEFSVALVRGSKYLKLLIENDINRLILIEILPHVKFISDTERDVFEEFINFVV